MCAKYKDFQNLFYKKLESEITIEAKNIKYILKRLRLVLEMNDLCFIKRHAMF